MLEHFCLTIPVCAFCAVDERMSRNGAVNEKREDPKILPPGEDGFNPKYGARCTVRQKWLCPFSICNTVRGDRIPIYGAVRGKAVLRLFDDAF